MSVAEAEDGPVHSDDGKVGWALPDDEARFAARKTGFWGKGERGELVVEFVGVD